MRDRKRRSVSKTDPGLNKTKSKTGEFLMAQPNNSALTRGNFMFLNLRKALCLAGSAAASGRLLRRTAAVLFLAIGFGLLAGVHALAMPTLMHEDATNYDGNWGNTTLNNFFVMGGSERMLIVCVADESGNPVDSVTLSSGAGLTYVGGKTHWEGANHTTSMWILMDADMPADGAYNITASGGEEVSIVAML
jgi:hypothetical protein